MQIVYDKETCGRCGGTGEYSYCQTYGRRCFKCGGQKMQLTRAGKKAKAVAEAWKAEHAVIRAGDVTVGTVIVNEAGKRVPVTKVAPSRVDEGHVVLTYKDRSPFGYCEMGVGMRLDMTLNRPLTTADIKALAEHLTASKVRKGWTLVVEDVATAS